MRWDIGKVYKEIRKSKGISQTEVCGDQISRTSLSKFETCQTVPSIENMIFLLNQINMSMEEFHYICNLYKPSKRQDILNLAYSHISITGLKELEHVQQLCNDYLKVQHDIPIQHINDMLTIIIHLRKHGLDNSNIQVEKITQKIWKYLEKEDNWYFTDFQLLNSILFHFPIENLDEITAKIFKRISKYENYANIQPLKRKLLTNLSTIYLYSGDKSMCERVTLEMLNFAHETKRYDSLAFAQVRLGICQNNDDLIAKGLTLLELTGETQLLENLRKEVKNYR